MIILNKRRKRKLKQEVKLVLASIAMTVAIGTLMTEKPSTSLPSGDYKATVTEKYSDIEYGNKVYYVVFEVNGVSKTQKISQDMYRHIRLQEEVDTIYNKREDEYVVFKQ